MSTARRTVFSVQLATVMAVGTSLSAALGVLGPLIVDDFMISRTQFGWIMSVMTFVSAASSRLIGRASDRIGGRRLAIASCLWAAFIITMVGAAPSVVLVAIGSAAMGLSVSAGNPATNQLIADHVPAGRRGVPMGIKQSGVQAGTFLAGVSLPGIALLVGWRGALGVVASAAVAVAVALHLGLPSRPNMPPQPRAAMQQSQAVAPAVRWIGAYAGFMGAGAVSFTAFLPLYARDVLGMPATRAGGALAVVGLLGVLSRVVASRVAERSNRYVVALGILSLLATASVLLVMAASRWPPLVWFAAIVAGVGAMAWNAVANLAAVTLSGGGLAGRASSYINARFMSGFAVGPLVFGPLADTFGYLVAWVAPALSCTTATVLMWVWNVRTVRHKVGDGAGQAASRTLTSEESE